MNKKAQLHLHLFKTNFILCHTWLTLKHDFLVSGAQLRRLPLGHIKSFWGHMFRNCSIMISLGKSSQGEWGGWGMWHAWERREKFTRFWWESPEGKRPLGRPRRRWEDGIRMDLGEIGMGGVDWIQLSQDRDRWQAVVSAVMNLRVLAPRS
jgi:hypothetical protein